MTKFVKDCKLPLTIIAYLEKYNNYCHYASIILIVAGGFTPGMGGFPPGMMGRGGFRPRCVLFSDFTQTTNEKDCSLCV